MGATHLGQGSGESVHAEDTEDLGSSDGLDLGDSVAITQSHTDLARGQTLLGELEDLRLHRVSIDLAPGRRRCSVRPSGTGDTVSGSMHATHDEIDYLAV
jgi:hypothetical protein